jgi:hypothetical protein
VCDVLDSDSTGGVRPSRVKRAEPTRIFLIIHFYTILQIIVWQQLVRLHLRWMNLKFKSDVERSLLQIILSFGWKKARTTMISTSRAARAKARAVQRRGTIRLLQRFLFAI